MGNRLRERLHAEVDPGELRDVGKLLLDDRAAQVAHVQVDVVLLRADPPPVADLEVDRPADHVAGGQLHRLRRVPGHEALALGVEERAAFAARGLREEDPDPVDPGGMELVELHVLQRDAVPVGEGHPVAGQRVRVRGDREHPAVAARGEQDGLGPERVELPVRDPVGHDAGGAAAVAALPALEEQVHDVVLVVEAHAGLDAVLVERLEDHVARPVRGEAGPLDRGLPEVPGMAAEPALVDLPVRRPVEGQAHVLELDHRLDRLVGKDLGRVLVDEVVAALDGVEHVPLPVVLLLVPQGSAHAALGGAGVGAGRVELREDARQVARQGELERGP